MDIGNSEVEIVDLRQIPNKGTYEVRALAYRDRQYRGLLYYGSRRVAAGARGGFGGYLLLIYNSPLSRLGLWLCWVL